MKKFILSACTLSVALYSTGCGTTQDTLNALAPNIPQPTLRQNPNQLQTFSNQTLGAVSKRLKLMTFQWLDSNKDGFLSRQEFGPYSTYPGGPSSDNFDKIDKNKDGKISFREAEGKEFGQAFGNNPAQLREQARYSWKYINRNNDTFVTLDEMLQTLAPPLPPGQPIPCCPGSAVPVPRTGYGDPYTSPPGGGYYPGNPYGYPMDEYTLRQLKVELTKAFNLADKNLDQRLTMSEYEDLFALNMVSERETPYPSYPQPITTSIPAYPDPVVTSSPTASPGYPSQPIPSATSDTRRR